MSYETEFMKEFEEWIKTQVMINEMALEAVSRVSSLYAYCTWKRRVWYVLGRGKNDNCA